MLRQVDQPDRDVDDEEVSELDAVLLVLLLPPRRTRRRRRLPLLLKLLLVVLPLPVHVVIFKKGM